jgi:hypothetical protein
MVNYFLWAKIPDPSRDRVHFSKIKGLSELRSVDHSCVRDSGEYLWGYNPKADQSPRVLTAWWAQLERIVNRLH